MLLNARRISRTNDRELINNHFTPKTEFPNLNSKTKMVPCESTYEEVAFVWPHHRILRTDLITDFLKLKEWRTSAVTAAIIFGEECQIFNRFPSACYAVRHFIAHALLCTKISLSLTHRYCSTSKIQETAGQRCFGKRDHAIVNLPLLFYLQEYRINSIKPRGVY